MPGSHAPALRQLVLDCAVQPGWQSCGLHKRDMEALVHLQCQQLDVLTLVTHIIDEQSVSLLARIKCPLKLDIDTVCWSSLGSAPLFTLLAGLPNLTELELTLIQYASNVLWDQRGAILPYVQRLKVVAVPLRDSLLTCQSILGMCPALKHLHLHSASCVTVADRLEFHADLWHAFKSCAKLASLTIAGLQADLSCGYE